MRDKPKTHLLGIRTLVVLTVVAALLTVGCEFLVGTNQISRPTKALVWVASAITGVTSIVYSLLAAIYIGVFDKPLQLKKRKLRGCLHLFIFGLIASLPAFAMTLIGILRY